jgi:hypothetical protein
MTDYIFNPEEQLKKFIYDRKEEKNHKRPSKHFLKSYAEKILEVARNWQKRNTFSVNSNISVMHSVDIFIADLESDLEISNDKKYKIVWKEKYDELRSIQFEFLKNYIEELGEGGEILEFPGSAKYEYVVTA